MDNTLKQRIAKEAQSLFFLNGIKRVTMDDIAFHTGISKRTLYESFNDKEQLLLCCIMEQEAEVRQRIEALKKEPKSSIELILDISHCILQNIRMINRSFYSDLQRYHPTLAERHEQGKQEKLQWMTDIMLEGMNDGSIRPDINIEIVLALLQAQFQILANSSHKITLKYSFSEIFEPIIINFVRGIATAKGLDEIELREQRHKHLN